MDIIDEATFSGLLEVDDYEFAKGIVDEFFEQAGEVLQRFQQLLSEKNWEEVGKLGHHLKGSSAAVGAANVRDICDEIQHYTSYTKGRDPAIYLRRKVESLKAAIPLAQQHLARRLEEVPH